MTHIALFIVSRIIEALTQYGKRVYPIRRRGRKPTHSESTAASNIVFDITQPDRLVPSPWYVELALDGSVEI